MVTRAKIDVECDGPGCDSSITILCATDRQADGFAASQQDIVDQLEALLWIVRDWQVENKRIIRGELKS